MWKAQNPKQRDPFHLEAFVEENLLTLKDINEFMTYENYAQDLASATRFLIINDLPDLMWSIYERTKDKRQAKDLESLMRLLFDKKVIQESDAGNVFSAYDEDLTPEQRKQIAERLNKNG